MVVTEIKVFCAAMFCWWCVALCVCVSVGMHARMFLCVSVYVMSEDSHRGTKPCNHVIQKEKNSCFSIS